MISGVVEFGGAKSDLTDQEGLARRVSKSSEGGLVAEESVRVVDALAVWTGWNLRVRKSLGHCLCVIAQVSLRDAGVAGCNARCIGLGNQSPRGRAEMLARDGAVLGGSRS